jgi:hypothetical protein
LRNQSDSDYPTFPFAEQAPFDLTRRSGARRPYDRKMRAVVDMAKKNPALFIPVKVR